MITVKQVADWMNLKNDGASDANLPGVVEATNVLVSSMPDIQLTTAVVEGVPVQVWAQTTVLGATMLAARIHGRRNSPNGLEAVGEMGTSYVARYDPDIARLLNLDSFKTPRVG